MRKPRGAQRVVSVRYRVSVYADVDLDSGEVIGVVEDDESVRLDVDESAGVGSSPPEADVALDVVEIAFGPDAEPYLTAITPEVAAEAVAIAEMSAWPEWERP